MDDAEMESLRYPVGRYAPPDEMNARTRRQAIAVLADFPQQLRLALRKMDDEQFDTPYRPGGWTVRMLTHHLGDSHMNAFLRIRFALTEDRPTIMPYNEDAWAHLHDDMHAPPMWSVQLLEALHARWVMLLQGLDESQWKRAFVHPEHGQQITVEQALFNYAWHCRHHLAHITNLRRRMRW